MNPQADGGTATASEIYNQTLSYRETFALGQSRLAQLASLLRRASSRRHILGIKSDLSAIFLSAWFSHVGYVFTCGRVKSGSRNSDATPHPARPLLLKVRAKPLKYVWPGSIVTQH
jgi:hypothetical protein